MNYKILYDKAINHRTEHDCSAYPYEEYERLVEYIKKYEPKNILEIGTGIGFTATVMLSTNPAADILTIEKDSEHCSFARQFLIENGILENRFEIINDNAEIELRKLPSDTYDFIFFDGYQIHYEFLPNYQRLLKQNGILYLANNHLKSRTSNQFFESLEKSGKWQILEKFAETTVAVKL